MISQKHLKKLFAIIMVVGLVMIVIFWGGPHHLKKASITFIEKQIQYFAEIDSENQSMPAVPLSDFEASVLRNKAPHSKNVIRNYEKTSAISKCGYDVS